MSRPFCLLAIVVSIAAVGCDESSSENSTQPGPSGTCQADVCQDAATLIKCNNGIPSVQPCAANEKCEGNQCRAANQACTADVCLNETTLNKCVGGSFSAQPCPEGQTCVGNACQNKGTSGCTKDECLNETTLNKCVGGSFSAQPCGNQKICKDGACKPGKLEPENVDLCANDSTLKIWEFNKYVEYSCGKGRHCKDGKCIADQVEIEIPECVPKCKGELSKEYHACVNGSLAVMESTCPEGKLCVWGGCVDAFVEKDSCDDDQGVGYCTDDKFHAVVCDNHSKRIWTCKSPCSVGKDGVVDCPKKEVKVTYDPQCDPKTYKANCFNHNSSVHVCKDRQIETWECYAGTCSVDSGNQITCPKTAGLAGLGGLESGGTYGDECNIKTYQEECIDSYYARICDTDGVVRIKPAKDCKPSASDPHKVEYDPQGTVCPATDYMPVCINNGTAIGFCGYTGDDDFSKGIYKAAQCPGCDGEKRAVECMYL